MNIGLLLGTFDPPHIGHIYLAVQALQTKQVDEVWLVPAYNSPWKPNTTPYEIRADMCKDLTNPYDNIRVWLKEEEVKSENTYQFLNNIPVTPAYTFKIIGGSDIDISKWYKGEWILKNYEVIKVSRQNFECSSTMIRDTIKAGKDPRPFLPQNVYNSAKNLYK